MYLLQILNIIRIFALLTAKYVTLGFSGLISGQEKGLESVPRMGWLVSGVKRKPSFPLSQFSRGLFIVSTWK